MTTSAKLDGFAINAVKLEHACLDLPLQRNALKRYWCLVLGPINVLDGHQVGRNVWWKHCTEKDAIIWSLPSHSQAHCLDLANQTLHSNAGISSTSS